MPSEAEIVAGDSLSGRGKQIASRALVVQAAFDRQIRSNWGSPVAVISTVGVPFAYLFVIQTLSAGDSGVGQDRLLAACGIGILDGMVTLLVITLLGEKRDATIAVLLGAPFGFIWVLFGRLTGIAIQALAGAPVVVALAWLSWGTPQWDHPARFAIGVIAVLAGCAGVLGPLAYAILRFPYSAGMTNGILGVFIASSGMIAPPQDLPPTLGVIAQFFPHSHILTWVRGGAHLHLAIAIGEIATLLVATAALLSSYENSVRSKAVSLAA